MVVPEGNLAKRRLILAFSPAGMLFPAMIISLVFAMAQILATKVINA